MAFLSFNPNSSCALEYSAADSDEYGEVLKRDLPLKFPWVLWEQIMQVSDGSKAPQHYSDATHKVATFNTVQQFWRVWNSMPQPSELLDQKRMVREVQPNELTRARATGDGGMDEDDSDDPGPLPTSTGLHVIDAIMIFRKGVKPEWEHPANANGGHFQFQLKSTIEPGQIDEYWNNLVLGVVGGAIEPAEIITGVRLVDKLSGPRQANGIRLEVWFSQYEDKTRVGILKKNIERCMSTRLDGIVGPIPKCDAKTHQTGKH